MSSSSRTSSMSDVGNCVWGTSNLNTKMYDKCPVCKHQYEFMKKSNISKIPLILNCKHTVCEECIRNMCLADKTVCPVCNVKFTVSRTQFNSLSDFFQPHFTLIGHLVWSKKLSNKKELTWRSTGSTLEDRNASGGGDVPDPPLTSELHNPIAYDGIQTFSPTFDKCSQHSDQYLNIECKNCDDIYCCYCFLENHAGHKHEYLYKLSDAEMAELEKFKACAEVVLAQLLKSRKQTELIKGPGSSDVDQEIRNYFVELHAKLHLAERNIRKKLSSVELAEIDVNDVNHALKSATHRVTKLLAYFNMLNTNQLNMRALFEEAQSVMDIPCRLVSDERASKPVELFSTNALDDIEDTVCLKEFSSTEYSLVPIEDWSTAEEKYELSQIRKQTDTQLSHSAISTETKSDAATVVKVNKKPEIKTTKSTEGKIRIVVTHINDINSFYIQKFSTLESLKEMNSLIGRRNRKRQGQEFKIGNVYGVSYDAKSSIQWRRGKVVDIFNNEEGVTQYKVFFIDYGNTKTVTYDKLKEIDLYTIRRQNFAYECKLAHMEDLDLEPNIHLQLPQIVGNKELYVRFLDSQSNRNRVHEVEIFVSASNGGIISVRDLLLKTFTPVPNTKSFLLSSELRLFKNSTKFRVGQDEQVVVTYVRDPFYMCVQLAKYAYHIEKMRAEMDEYYKSAPVIDCIPVIDTDVVVMYQDEVQGMYHRAKITSVNVFSKEVEVHCVDWGKDVAVPWSRLKLLTEEFIKMECLGIIVRLADVGKVNSNEAWSPKVVTFLTKQVARNHVWRMAVSRVEDMEVALFEPTPSSDICLNSLLVEEQLAVSTGPITHTIFWPKSKEKALQDDDDDDLSFQLLKKSEQIIIADEDLADLNRTVKFQVVVVDFQSPDLIYVKFTKNNAMETEFYKALKIHYTTEKSNPKRSWKLDQNCVVFDKEKREYCRAKIKLQVNKDFYLVYLYDHAGELTVHRNNMYSLHPYFRNFPSNVVKCRLSKVKPAGDGGKWSQLAIEMLQKIFTSYKTIHIAKCEMNSQEKILGVTMWYSYTTAAKALEPAKVQFISINQSLVESGVALVDLSTVPPSPAKHIATVEDNLKKPSWNDLICEAEETRDVSENPAELFETFQEGWPKPFKIEQEEFQALVTCVVNEGYFCVRDEQLQNMYRDVEKQLNSTFKSQPTNEPEVIWQVNDMCTILYDGMWYRGTILEVLSSTEVNVEMIDFGSEHVLLKDDLTKAIMFPDCPPLVYKIQLYDVHSRNGHWTAEDVDEMLSIVTDHVKISIKGNLAYEVPFAEVYLDNGVSVNDLITRRCPHMVRSENHNNLEVADYCQEDELDDSKETDYEKYTYVGLPQLTDDSKKMYVINLINIDCSYSIVLCNEKKCSDPSKNFLRLVDTIQRQAEEQQSLQCIQLNASCICIHSQKKLWSRGVVYNVDSLSYGFVWIFFVDYGTVEMIPVKNIKEVRPEWLDFPVYMHIAAIDIELLHSNQREFVLMQMSDLRGTRVSVKVTSMDPLKVHLYDGDNLVYQDLIDCGIIKEA